MDADFVGIGLGPFLGLACLTEPIDDLNGIFLEAKPDFDWHSGMFLEGAHLERQQKCLFKGIDSALIDT